MNLRSTIIGIAASATLLAVLGFARLFTIPIESKDLTIREIETATFTPPPPPPPPEEPPSDTPPPPPSLTEVSALPDPTRVPIPQADIPMDITVPVENFFTDLAPSPLPQSIENITRTPPTKTPTLRPTQPTKPNPPPVAKSQYNANELDGIPRLLRHGTATFPTSLARNGITSGTVTFEVELSTSGSVSIRRVISSSHPDFVAPARRVAAGARFTPPKKNGQPVKAIMSWPITIKK